MTDKREITEADVDAAIAGAFGRAPIADPAKPVMSLERAEDVRMGRVFGRPGLTVEMAREAEGVIAYHAQQAVAKAAVVEAGDGMSKAQRTQLDHARLRVIGAAMSKGLTGAPAVEYGDAVMRQVHEAAVAQGRSFDEVIAAVDAEAAALRLKPGRPSLT